MLTSLLFSVMLSNVVASHETSVLTKREMNQKLDIICAKLPDSLFSSDFGKKKKSELDVLKFNPKAHRIPHKGGIVFYLEKRIRKTNQLDLFDYVYDSWELKLTNKKKKVQIFHKSNETYDNQILIRSYKSRFYDSFEINLTPSKKSASYFTIAPKKHSEQQITVNTYNYLMQAIVPIPDDAIQHTLKLFICAPSDYEKRSKK